MSAVHIIDKPLRTMIFEMRCAVAVVENGDPVILTSDFNHPKVSVMRDYIQSTETLNKGRFLGHSPIVRQVSQATIDDMLGQLAENTPSLQQDSQPKSDVANRLKDLLQIAVKRKCSDVHVEVYSNKTLIFFRIDGRRVLHLDQPDNEYGGELISYIFMSKAKPKDQDYVETEPNNGRVEELLKVGDIQKVTTWRAAYIPTTGLGKLTMRLMDGEDKLALEDTGLEIEQIKLIRSVISGPSGLVLVSGKVGSGKTNFLASIIAEIDPSRSIHTLEDPPEGNLGVPQTFVNPGRIRSKTNAVQQEQSFAWFSKLLLRHDVDVEMHGEIRDHAGAMEATRKGETGQLVLASLHCSSAIGIGPTMINQFKVPAAVVASPDLMRLWIYQTLIRKLCPNCKMTGTQARHYYAEQTELSGDTSELEKFERIHAYAEMLITDTSNVHYKHPKGCSHCVEGEKGRTAVAEILYLDDEDRQFLSKQLYLDWADALKKKGYKTVRDHAITKIAQGIIDIETASGKVNDLLPKTASAVYEEFAKSIKGADDLNTTNKGALQ